MLLNAITLLAHDLERKSGDMDEDPYVGSSVLLPSQEQSTPDFFLVLRSSTFHISKEGMLPILCTSEQH